MNIFIDYDILDESNGNVVLPVVDLDQSALKDLGECIVSMIESAIENEKLKIEEERRINEQT